MILEDFEGYNKDKAWWFFTYMIFAEIKSQDPERYEAFCDEFIFHFYRYGPPSLRRDRSRFLE